MNAVLVRATLVTFLLGALVILSACQSTKQAKPEMPSVTFRNVPCGPAPLIAQAQQDMGLSFWWRSRDAEGSYVDIYRNPQGGWTMSVTDPNTGLQCIIRAGPEFKPPVVLKSESL